MGQYDCPHCGGQHHADVRCYSAFRLAAVKAKHLAETYARLLEEVETLAREGHADPADVYDLRIRVGVPRARTVLAAERAQPGAGPLVLAWLERTEPGEEEPPPEVASALGRAGGARVLEQARSLARMRWLR